MRVASAIALLLAVLAGAVAAIAGAAPAQAGDCLVEGPLPHLDSQPVEWTFAIAGGQRCLRGLRSGAMLLDSVAIGAPARFGEATAQGYGFAYQAPKGFKGEDLFSVVMSGRYRGVRGTSTINVRVTVR